MHNLTLIKKLVDEHLDGNLLQIKYKYVSERNYVIVIRYTNQWEYSCEYKIAINEEEENIEFCYHVCDCQFQKVKLQQEKRFEIELLTVLRRYVGEEERD